MQRRQMRRQRRQRTTPAGQHLHRNFIYDPLIAIVVLRERFPLVPAPPISVTVVCEPQTTSRAADRLESYSEIDLRAPQLAHTPLPSCSFGGAAGLAPCLSWRLSGAAHRCGGALAAACRRWPAWRCCWQRRPPGRRLLPDVSWLVALGALSITSTCFLASSSAQLLV